MGRAGDSSDYELPPRSGGGSPLQEDLLVGGKRGGPWVKMIVAVVVELIITKEILLLSKVDRVRCCGSSPVRCFLIFLQKQTKHH